MGRHFFNFHREYGRNSVNVWGSYEVNELDLLEIRSGGSWKNDYRDFYIIMDGELNHIGSAMSTSERTKVKKYLKGDITLEDLLAG